MYEYFFTLKTNVQYIKKQCKCIYIVVVVLNCNYNVFNTLHFNVHTLKTMSIH